MSKKGNRTIHSWGKIAKANLSYFWSGIFRISMWYIEHSECVVFNST